MMKTISKSRFISGIQCHKKIWFDFYRKDLRLPTDPTQQRVFDLGHEIGRLAQQMFPNGKDATPENFYDLKPAAIQTKKWIDESVHTNYEATFIAENTSAMLDILHKTQDKFWAIEVKNSTSAKEYQIMDAALQYFVMTKSGFVPDRFFLMYVNNQYVKNGEIDKEFFKMEDITETVLQIQDWVLENLQKLKEIVESPNEPNVPIGNHCNDPFGCDYQHHCWKHIPEKSVFELTRGGNKSWELYEKNILKLEDIPDDFPLTFNQQLQINGLKNGAETFEKELISNFIKDWKFPLHYFDFETIMPAIPLLDGTRPYQQIPFQYSLHIQSGNDELIHKEFLVNPTGFSGNATDPRKLMIEQMKKDFSQIGSIVTYNLPFERRILQELARDFPEDAVFLHGIVERLVDLLPIFRNRWYYKAAMGGSASIKSVLPAILPQFSYADLEIQEGGTASDSFLQSIHIPENYTEKLSYNLLKYCELDTFAMVEIYKHLKEKIS